MRQVTKHHRAVIERIKREQGIATDSGAVVHTLDRHTILLEQVERLTNDRHRLRQLLSDFLRMAEARKEAQDIYNDLIQDVPRAMNATAPTH